MELITDIELVRQKTETPHVNAFVDVEGRHYGESRFYSGHVILADVCTNLLAQDVQSASLYVQGVSGYPALGRNLRFEGLDDNYYMLAIHPQDVPKFVQRVIAYRAGYHGRVVRIEGGTSECYPATEDEWLDGLAFLQREDLSFGQRPYDFYSSQD